MISPSCRIFPLLQNTSLTEKGDWEDQIWETSSTLMCICTSWHSIWVFRLEASWREQKLCKPCPRGPDILLWNIKVNSGSWPEIPHCSEFAQWSLEEGVWTFFTKPGYPPLAAQGANISLKMPRRGHSPCTQSVQFRAQTMKLWGSKLPVSPGECVSIPVCQSTLR